jgi:hypothetical protein
VDQLAGLHRGPDGGRRGVPDRQRPDRDIPQRTYVVGENRLAVDVDYTVWGWVHLVLGLVAGAAAFGLLAGQTWARAVVHGGQLKDGGY